MRALALAALLAASAAVVGCHGPLQAWPARGFVELKDDKTYDFRAVAPDGVAVAARAVPLDGAPADLAFWERALTLRMRELDGYALLEARDVRGADGAAGRELVFGHDVEEKPFVYRLRVFVVNYKVLVIEAVGSKENMQRYAPNVAWMHATISVRRATRRRFERAAARGTFATWIPRRS